MNETPEISRSMMQLAAAARKQAYAPYSGFAVGAALLEENGRIFTGCNVENAAFGPSICAERTALVKAVSEGYRQFSKIVIAGGRAGQEQTDFCPPCGVCRQMLREFCEPESFQIVCIQTDRDGVVTEQREYTLAQLLPESFGPDQLG